MAIIANDAKMRQLQMVSIMKYKLGMSNVDIAKKLGVSAMSISRFLDSALECGIVKISVQTPIEEDEELEKKLQKKYGLRDAIVVTGDLGSDPLSATTTAAAEYLDLILTNSDVLGIAAGKTIGKVIPKMRLTSVTDCSKFKVVQLMGGNYYAGKSNPSSMISGFASRFGANGFLLQQPLYAKTEDQFIVAKESLWPTFVQQWKSCTAAVLALGTISPAILNDSEGMFDENDYREIVSKNAVGRVFGHWIDADGNVLDCSCNRRIFSIPIEVAKSIPIRVGITSGIKKAEVLKAALKANLINVIVSDSKTIKFIL